MKENETRLIDLYFSFLCIGLMTFGGGMAMLPMLKVECVEKYGWVTEEEMIDLFAVSQCTPGIIAVNIATYIGYKERKISGAIATTLGVLTPSVVIILLIASILKKFISYPVVRHAFAGIRVAVCALLLKTGVDLTRKSVIDKVGVIFFVVALGLAIFSPLPITLIVILAGLIGLAIGLLKKGGPS